MNFETTFVEGAQYANYINGNESDIVVVALNYGTGVNETDPTDGPACCPYDIAVSTVVPILNDMVSKIIKSTRCEHRSAIEGASLGAHFVFKFTVVVFRLN